MSDGDHAGTHLGVHQADAQFIADARAVHRQHVLQASSREPHLLRATKSSSNSRMRFMRRTVAATPSARATLEQCGHNDRHVAHINCAVTVHIGTVAGTGNAAGRSMTTAVTSAADTRMSQLASPIASEVTVTLRVVRLESSPPSVPLPLALRPDP